MKFCNTDEILCAIARLEQKIVKLEERIMASQSDIDAAVAALTSMQQDEAAQVAQLIADFSAIQTEITNLQGQGVDTTALNAAVAQAQSTAATLDPAVAQITGLAPAAPAPTPPAGPTPTSGT